MTIFALPALGQDEIEESFAADVTASGDADLCITADVGLCEGVGTDPSGQLEVVATVSADTADQLEATLTGCPDGRAGGVITVSGLEADATVHGTFAGQATVDDEAVTVEETVGPVDAGSDGLVHVSVCGSAQVGITPGVPELPELPGLETPEEPELPELPGLETPEEPELPELPGLETPEEPEGPDVPDEFSHSVEVGATGDAELCVEVDDEELCVGAGADPTGELQATVGGTAQPPDVAVEECPDDRTGVALVLSGLEVGATVEGAFTGSTTVDGESVEIDETVGPIQVDGDGQAIVSLCASADASGAPDLPDDPEEPDQALVGGLIPTLLELVGGLLPQP